MPSMVDARTSSAEAAGVALCCLHLYTHKLTQLIDPRPKKKVLKRTQTNVQGGSCGDYFAAGNFTEVTEKRVGNFADHLQCNTVYGLVDPKTHGLICPLPKKS